MISIVIPARNEERRIGKTLEEYLQFYKKLKAEGKLNFEIIVVLNDCKDKTKQVAESYSCKELKILEFQRGGKGYAITKGFEYALEHNNKLIGFVDADMSTSPADFFDLIKKIGNYDMAIAGRYMKGSVVMPKQKASRIIVSRLGNFMIRALFLMPYRDTQCGAKVCKSTALKEIINELSITEWAFDVNLIYSMRKKGFKIKEIPTKWKDQSFSGLNLKKASIQCFLSVFQLRIINSGYKRLLRPLRYIKDPLWRIVK